MPVSGFDLLPKIVEEISADIERICTDAMGDVAQGLKTDWRQQIVDAGLGKRLANTVRAKRYPESGFSANAAAFVWTKAPNIIEAHNRGATIVPVHGGKYLAWPTPEAGVKHSSGRKHARITPALWERETGVKLQFLKPRNSRYAFLVSKGHYRRQAVRYQRRKSFRPIKEAPIPGEAKTIVIFILAPVVTLPKRLDIESLGDHWAGQVDDAISRRWK
jgi:hypothetical protein